jgi:hypothetical protein
VLIDFKTDQVADAAVLRERYSEQLTIYQRAIATALKLRASQVEVVLLSTHLGVVEPLHRRRACADKPRAGGGLPGTGPGDCVGGTSAGLSFPGWSADEAT